MYVKRWTATHQRNVLAALTLARRQLNRLEAAKTTSAPTTGTASAKGKAAPAPKQQSGSSVIQAAQLSSKINQLEAQLGIVGVRQVKPAKPRASTLVSPHPRKNAEFAFVIALVLGCVRRVLPQPLQPPAAHAGRRRRRRSTRRC